MVVVIGSGSNAYTYNPSNPSDTSRPSPSQQNQYKEMADSMKKAGIRGVSGRTLVTDDDERGFNVGEKAREIQKNYLEERDPVVRTPYEDTLFDFGLDLDNLSGVVKETAGDPIRQKIVSNILKGKPSKKTGIFGIDFNNLSLPGAGPLLGTLQGLENTNKFFKNLNTKKSGELSNTDLITLIKLVQRGGEGGGLQYLKNWAEDNDLSEEETMDLANKFTGEYSNIASSISDSGINEYFDTKPEGFKDSVAAMFGQYRDEDNPGPNLEYVTDNLGTVGLEYLKATNPAAFYALRPAATSGQIEELARTALTGNKDFDNQIFAAREQAARNKESQDRASGIMTASSAPPAPPPVVPPVVPPAEDEVPENPILNPIMSQRDPFDLAKFYASLPQYTQQGVMSPSLMQYYRNLGLFPRA